MKKNLRNVLYGLLSWIIPFVAAIPFYSPEGTLTVDVFLFKSIMIVVGSIVGAILLVSYFNRITTSHLREGIIVGITWFAINIVMDLLILLPISGMTIPDYFAQIGMRYIVLMVMAISMGIALAKKV